MKNSNLNSFSDELRQMKFRNELKYVCSEADLVITDARVRSICHPDPHAGPDGIYNIRSIYFDDLENRYFHENEDGTDPREKFRIRIYNGSSQRITLERKVKQRTMTHKDSCRISLEQFYRILDRSLTPTQIDSALLQTLFLLQQQRSLEPKVIVAYDRTPFIYSAGNVRITFDRNIGSTTDLDHFFDPYLPVRPILPAGKQILEVKYDAFLPNFLYDVMNLGSLRQTTFSKYYLCRKFTV